MAHGQVLNVYEGPGASHKLFRKRRTSIYKKWQSFAANSNRGMHCNSPVGVCKDSAHIPTYTDTAGSTSHVTEHFTQQPGPIAEPSLFLGDILAPFCNHLNIHNIQLLVFFSPLIEILKEKGAIYCVLLKYSNTWDMGTLDNLI